MTEHTASIRLYTAVFVALLVLLGATVGAARLELGALGPPVAMAIAVAKTLLIVLYFMHVRWSSRVTRVFVGAGFLWLAILLILMMSDYLTRDWPVG